MLVEQIIFTFISFAIFVYMFFRIMKGNDTVYTGILVLEAIGIALNFVEVLFNIKLNVIFQIIKYILAILLPIGLIIMEKRYISLFELINISKARASFALGDTRKAKQLLLKVLDSKKDCYKAHLLLAQIYEKQGEIQKSIDEYVQVLDINKNDYDSYYKVSELLNKLNKKNEASEMLFNLLNKKPDMNKASELLGDILIEREMYKEAAKVYQDAIKYNPLNYELHYNLGIVYTMLNDFQNAKMAYEKAAEINSLSYNSKYSLAEIALMYRELEEAERKFLEVIEDEELSADAYYELAKISLIKMDKDTAIKYINIAIDINSKKIVEKIKQDDIFIPIMAKIIIPQNLEGKLDMKLKTKEVKAKERLEDMSDKARTLGYNDIKLIKKISHREEKSEEEKNIEENERKYRE